jgi:hypothetical protein
MRHRKCGMLLSGVGPQTKVHLSVAHVGTCATELPSPMCITGSHMGPIKFMWRIWLNAPQKARIMWRITVWCTTEVKKLWSILAYASPKYFLWNTFRCATEYIPTYKGFPSSDRLNFRFLGFVLIDGIILFVGNNYLDVSPEIQIVRWLRTHNMIPTIVIRFTKWSL